MNRRRPRLLLVAPRLSYRIAAYLRAAAALDVEILVASDGAHSLISALAEGLHIDPADPEDALRRLHAATAERAVDGVVGTDDGTVELASVFAASLGLPGNPPAAARFARRKDIARACLAAAGVAVPAHQTMTLAEIAAGLPPRLPFPLVAKPLSLSASRGVIRVDDVEALRRAAHRIRPMLAELASADERETLLLERYIPGRELALEGMLDQGRLTVLALFDKPDPLEGPYFEETYYITPSREPASIRAAAAECVQAACAAYGLTTGPVHAELRVDGDRVYVLEVAARTIGGQCARLLELGTGHSLEALVIARALRQDLDFAPAEGAAGVLMIPIPRAGVLRRVEGVLAASEVPFIEDLEISVREGYELVPLPEGSSYLGFVFARAPSAEQVEAALRQAHTRLKVVTAPVWRIGAQVDATPA